MPAKELSPAQVEAKRERERIVVTEMIGLYCRGNHGTRKGELCDDCAHLAEYAAARVTRCPHMATKSFCSQCKTHCYAPAERAAIRDVMRYAGPRMLFHRPVMTIHHMAESVAAKRRVERKA